MRIRGLREIHEKLGISLAPAVIGLTIGAIAGQSVGTPSIGRFLFSWITGMALITTIFLIVGNIRLKDEP